MYPFFILMHSAFKRSPIPKIRDPGYPCASQRRCPRLYSRFRPCWKRHRRANLKFLTFVLVHVSDDSRMKVSCENATYGQDGGEGYWRLIMRHRGSREEFHCRSCPGVRDKMSQEISVRKVWRQNAFLHWHEKTIWRVPLVNSKNRLIELAPWWSNELCDGAL